jgi:hypothetical protein
MAGVIPKVRWRIRKIVLSRFRPARASFSVHGWFFSTKTGEEPLSVA